MQHLYPKTIFRKKENQWHRIDADFLCMVGSEAALLRAITTHVERGREEGDVVTLGRYIFIW